MGVYIKGMEMPKNCYGCPIAQGYYKPAYCGLNGSIPKLWKEFDEALEKEIKPDFCPLVAVPDHGRLIDADEFYADINESVFLTGGFKEVFNLWFDVQPTIIPAEEGTSDD